MRKATSGRRRSVPAAKPTYAGYNPAAAHAWAAGKGIEVNARGRIKADVVEKFRAAVDRSPLVTHILTGAGFDVDHYSGSSVTASSLAAQYCDPDVDAGARQSH